MAEKTFKSGEVIFQEKTYESCMYELLEGTVGIYTHYGQQDEKILTELTRDYLEVCRAASEMMETKGNGKEKSGWFNSFIEIIRTYLDSEDVREGLKHASCGHYAPFGSNWI